ncbi:sensor histidine kinase [Agitococcus lubricus]|uniref:histidine kinase n=1 Tax=Agitococcus lubricus TaxID=1077255 RepID=A0A2T5IZ24_9GAMM|nr:sensor histidine kinase [Agitococcus lubricus]PTQ89278.1 histidine kinase/DNA gyrase B/HSP90-like ATPase [Agitococcus lubricus]
MDYSFLILANNISMPVFIYNALGEILFANKFSIEKYKANIVGENISNIAILNKIDDLFFDNNIADVLWLDDYYNAVIRMFAQDGIFYYQCILDKSKNSVNLSGNKSEQQYKLLFGSLLSAQDSYRANLARELHDDLGQLLIALKISSFNVLIQKDIQHTKKMINEIMPLFDQAIKSLRDITKGLHPRFIREIGIKESLTNLINQIANLSEMKVELDISSEVIIDNQEIEYASYRICQEAINNAIKYSQAKKIYISIENTSAYFKLVISDNGQGFDMTERINSLGLLSMQERAEQTGGVFKINSKIGLGTRIQVVWSMINE